MFSLLDLILVVALAGFVFYGLFFGLIRTLGTLTGVLVGAFIASRLYLVISAWIEPLFFGYNNLGKVLVFLILFTIINRLVGFLFYFLDKTFRLIAILPFLKSFNRLAGAILGFFTGSLILGLAVFVISRYALLEYWIGQELTTSKIAPMLINVNRVLLPLLPEVLKKLKSLI